MDDTCMIHDRVMSRVNAAAKSASNRRESDRLPFPAEMVLVWNHDLETIVRYHVIDAGDGGYRVRSSLPLLEGTTGMVLRLLPSRGQQLDQPVMVAWSTQQSDGSFEIGLKC